MVHNKFIFEVDGKEYPKETSIVIKLLQDDVLFVMGSGQFFDAPDDKQPAALYVNCNDLFEWACADCEPLPVNELLPIIKMHLADPKWGTVKWSCIRRNLQPQLPIVERMKNDGAWDDAMESLPKNSPTVERLAAGPAFD